MNPKLAKQCNVILCSFLNELQVCAFHSSSPNVNQICGTSPPPFFNVAKTQMMFDNYRKSKFVSGSLLLLLPLVILRKYIIDFFQQNVWYYYMLDTKNNCPMDDSMKLCILDLLSCELALFSIVTYLLFYTFYVHVQ